MNSNSRPLSTKAGALADVRYSHNGKLRTANSEPPTRCAFAPPTTTDQRPQSAAARLDQGKAPSAKPRCHRESQRTPATGGPQRPPAAGQRIQSNCAAYSGQPQMTRQDNGQRAAAAGVEQNTISCTCAPAVFVAPMFPDPTLRKSTCLKCATTRPNGTEPSKYERKRAIATAIGLFLPRPASARYVAVHLGSRDVSTGLDRPQLSH